MSIFTFRGRQIDEHASLTVRLACPTERSDKKILAGRFSGIP